MHDLSIKYKAILHYKHLLCSIRKVSKIYNVSKSTLQRWLKESSIHVRKPRNKKTLRKDIASCINSTISENPFCSLKELAAQISSKCSLKHIPSLSTVSRMLKTCKMSYKNAKRFVDYSHDNKTVTEFAQTFLKEQENIICIDELGFYVGENPRKGWSKLGSRVKTPLHRCIRQKKFSVIVAISSKGVAKYTILESNCKKHNFIEFCKELDVPKTSRLLMDNVAFHKSKEVQSILKQRELIPMYIPPYSPRTNPIENVFGVIKPAYRKQCPVVQTQSFDYKGLFESIIDSYKFSDLSRYYKHVATFMTETLLSIQKDAAFRFIGYG